MQRRAWFFIWGVHLVAVSLVGLSLVLPFGNSEPGDWLTFFALALFASFSQLYKAITATSVQARSTTVSYSTNLVFFSAALFLLPPPLFAALVFVSHFAEWLFERLRQSTYLKAWYLQPFNIAMHTILGYAAIATYHGLQQLLPESGSSGIAAAFAGALVYVILNHIFLGLALSLVRNVTLRDAGLFKMDDALPDLINLTLGYIVAVLWELNPWFILPALAPLLLVHKALQVPQLKKEAHVDAKTGLLAPHRLNQLLEGEMDRAERFKRPLAVLMADLDLLRNINNSYGHLAGDAVLEGIGGIINNAIRQYDLAGRFGGEEFCLVLPETEPKDAKTFAERLRYEVERARFEVATSDKPIQATMSIGVACYPYDAVELDDLVHQADLAVYQAKFRGRNQVVSAEEIPHSTRLNSPPNEERLRVPHIATFTPRPRSSKVATATDTEIAATPPQTDLSAGGTKREEPKKEPAPEHSPKEPEPKPERKEESPADPPKPPPTKPTPILWCYIGAICLSAILLLSTSLYFFETRRWTIITILAILAFAAELFRINLYDDSTFSVSVAFNFAAALLGGLPGIALVSAAIVLAHRIRMRSQWFKMPTNWSMHILAGSAPVAALYLTGVPLQNDYLYRLILPLLIAAFLHYVISTAMVAGAISIAQRARFLTIWRGQYGWLVTHYIALCTLGLFLALAYLSQGPISVLIFTIPIFMMRYAQEQYVDRTRETMMELKRMNRELTRANDEIEEASKAIVRLNDELFVVLGKIIDARDPFVSGHATQVSYYATHIARSLGLSEERVEMVRQAGFLHDIGKIGIPEHILHKTSKLDDEEYEHMKRHVDLGGDLLENSHSLRHLAPFVRYHHERWNGKGYPEGLKGEEIPLEARILAVCDAVEAMASDRPYHRAMAPEKILEELRQGSGTQFDARVVDIFIQLVEKHGEAFIINSAQEVMDRYADDPTFSTYDFGLDLFGERHVAIANNLK